MLRLRTLPLATGRDGAALRVDPALILGLAYVAWAMFDRYDSMASLRVLPEEAAVKGALVVAAGVLTGVLLRDVAHVVAVWLHGGRVRSLTLTLLGTRSLLEPTSPGERPSLEWRASFASALATLIWGGTILAYREVLEPGRPLEMALGDLARIQVGLGLASLLPALPLPGGRIFRALAARRIGLVAATRVASDLGKALALASLVTAIVDGQVAYLFAAVFLYAGAVADERDDDVAALLAGSVAADAVEPPALVVSVHERVADVALALARAGVSAAPVVANDGAPLGAVGAADLRRVAPHRRWDVTIGDLVLRLGGVVRAGTPLAQVRAALRARRASAVAVVHDQGELVGVVTARAVDRRVALAELLSTPGGLAGVRTGEWTIARPAVGPAPAAVAEVVSIPAAGAPATSTPAAPAEPEAAASTPAA